MYDTILVPTDGSAPANRAVEHALNIAEMYESAVCAIFVVETHRYGEPAISSAELILNEIEERGHQLLEDVAERAEGVGLDATTKCCHGVPSEEIVSYADEIDADVIVLGFQGQSHAKEGHIGSVAERVVRHANRPVLTA